MYPWSTILTILTFGMVLFDGVVASLALMPGVAEPFTGFYGPLQPLICICVTAGYALVVGIIAVLEGFWDSNGMGAKPLNRYFYFNFKTFVIFGVLAIEWGLYYGYWVGVGSPAITRPATTLTGSDLLSTMLDYYTYTLLASIYLVICYLSGADWLMEMGYMDLRNKMGKKTTSSSSKKSNKSLLN